MTNNQRPPWWFITLLIIAILPLGSVPAMISSCDPGNTGLKFYIMLYPVVMLASALYSWRSYWTRPVLAWIMLVFMILITAAVSSLIALQ